MCRPWLLLRAACLTLPLASCAGLNSHSACYVLVWNAVGACWPEQEPPKLPPDAPRQP